MPAPADTLPLIGLLLAGAAGWVAGWIAGRFGRQFADLDPRGPGDRWRGAPAAVTSALALHAALTLPPALALAAIPLAAVLVAIAVADLEAMLIPDVLSLPLIPAGLALAALAPRDGADWAAALALHALAAAVGYGLIRGLGTLWLRWRGVEGIGQGDAKLLAAAGAWVGPAGLPGVLLYASLTGLVVALLRSRFGSSAPAGPREIPFGPFLALGFWIVLLHGPPALAG